ncbi:MAG TPA: choice-of-anchor D domain-containing protein [Candidatus Cloacimonetes bacterium]|nr:choice-of-anchor D domain-containing protein [Candidatus Cloacimonadota bacterium]
MKKAVIALVFILCIGMVWAEMVQESVAGSVALKFFENVSKDSASLSSIKGYPFSDAPQPDLYIVSFEPVGFVLIAADDRSEPVLGFDTQSLFSLDRLPAHVDWYLSQYSRSMAEIREHPEWVKDPKWEKLMNQDFSDYDFSRNVTPLCATTWDQNWPYNASCPLDSDGPGGRVYAGCVATAMAQVMKKWNHPITGQGSHSYNATGYGMQTADFGNTTYNWQDMPNSLTQQNTAVATLIYHCGVAVNMQYSPNGSGAYSSDARNALVSYFKYHDSAEMIYAHDYSATVWANKMRAELDLSRPMVYRGQGDDGGHAFVLDGYQGTNYFHFNWGWSGHYNGYYYLNNLNPSSYSFTDYQGAISSLYPVIEYQNDLAATAISGNQTPTVGEQSNYQISVENTGQNTQSNFTIQLCRDDGIVIGSTNGSYISPGETSVYHISWTPDAAGSHTLYGKVSLSSDQYPDNDATNALAVHVLPDGSISLQIGHGTSSNSTTNAHTPYGTWYKSFRQQYLLLSSELSDAGAVVGSFAALGFNVANVNNCSPMPNYTIRLKHTDLNSLSGSFETGTYQTVCEYDQFMPVNGWNTHVFDTPFIWDGQSNIIVDIATDIIPGSYTQNASVYYTSTTYNSCLRFQSDSVSGMDGTSGTASNNRANIKLLYVPPGSDPMLSVSPNVIDFGGVIAGVNTEIGSVYVSNAGGGNLVLNAGNLSFAGAHADLFSYDDIALPVSLGTGESVEIPLFVTGSMVGQISAAFLVSFDGETHEVELTGSCYDPVISQFPFFEGFEVGNAQGSTDINQWDQLLGGQFDTQRWTANSSSTNYGRTPRSGAWNVTLRYNGESTLFRPIMLDGGEEYYLEFWARQDTNTGATIKALLSANDQFSTDALEIVPASAVLSGDYQQFYGEFIAPDSGIYYLGIYGHTTINPWYISLDDITVALTNPPEELVPPSNLQASVDGMDVSLTWNAPGDDPIDPQWITWCNVDEVGNAIGTNSATVFDVAHRYDAGDLAAFQGMSLTKMKFVPNQEQCIYTAKIWTGTSASAPSQLVYSQVIPAPTIGAWNEVILNTPVPIPATGELWIGYEVDTQTGHPAGVDAGPPVAGKGNMMYFNNQWIQLTDAGATLTYNWSIQGFVDSPSSLALQPAVDANRSATRALTGYKVYRDNSLLATINDPAMLSYLDEVDTAGTYSYTVTAIYDGGESEPAGPVEIEVIDPFAPVFAITPTEHDYGEVNIGLSASQEFTISNAGEGMLTISDITISGAMMSLDTLPMLPADLGADQTLQFSAIFAPTEAGTHTGTITITDNLTRSVHTVDLSGTGFELELLPPTNLQASVDEMDVTLTWNEPSVAEWITWCNPDEIGNAISNSLFSLAKKSASHNLAELSVRHTPAIASSSPCKTRALTGYNIYRDEELIGNIAEGEDLIYIDTLTDYGSYSYTVTALYHEGESAPAGPVEVEIELIQPIFAITPESHDFGGVHTGLFESQEFTISNIGNGILTINEITISGAMMSLGTLPTLPAELDADTSLTFEAIYAPTQEGTHTGTITITDDLNRSEYLVSLSGMGLEALEPPTNLQADVDGMDVTLTWDPPATGDWISWCYHDAISNSFGLDFPIVFDVAHRYDASDLIAYQGSAITKVSFVPHESQCIYTIKLWTGTSPAAPTTLVHIQEVSSPVIGQWNEVMLTMPVSIPADNGLWIGYECNPQTGFPAGCDNGPQLSGKGNMIRLGGWSELTEIERTYTYNWSIRAYVDTEVRELVHADQPQSLTSNTTQHITESAKTRARTGYNLYRDEELIGSVDEGEELIYTDTVPEYGTYSYTVTAVYDGGESIPAGPVEVTTTYLEPPSNLSYSIDENNVILNWIAPAGHDHAPMIAPSPAVLMGYKVYRDGVFLDSINDPTFTTYTQYAVPNGYYEYGITAVYDTGESQMARVEVEIDHNLEAIAFQDGFESYPDFAVAFDPWTLIDQDESSSYGFFGIEFPGNATAFAFMIFNPSRTLPPIVEIPPFEGDKMAAAFAAVNGPNDDYLISPRIQLGDNSIVKFHARSRTAALGLEKFKVAVSTLPDPNNLDGYSYVSGDDCVLAPTDWTEFTYDISSYDNQQVFIAIHCISHDTSVFYVDNFSVRVGNTTSAEDDISPAATTQLNGNYPNPFNPETTISYNMKEAGAVSIDIYNIKGQLVKHLVKGEMPPGEHRVVWNGRDNNNRAVASGVYFLKMNAGDYSASRKMIMMK